MSADKKNKKTYVYRTLLVGIIVGVLLAYGSYTLSGKIVVALVPCWHRWIGGATSQQLGTYVVAVDYPWWIERRDPHGVAVFRPEDSSSYEVTEVRFVWDPRHEVDLEDDELCDTEMLQMPSEYRCYQSTMAGDDGDIVARRVRDDLLIFVSCGTDSLSCAMQAPKIESEIKIQSLPD